MKNVVSSERIPIKLWLDNIEDGALDQAKNLANLPFAFKWISIMPDSHQGYGMPIGGVLATNNMEVIPNAVGVDIGCVDKDTEYLSRHGWQKISEYDGNEVMQYNLEDGSSEFVKPIKYIKEKCDEFYHINTKYGVNQMLSSEHRCLVYKYDRSYNFDKTEILSAEEIYQKHLELKQGFRHRMNTTFTPKINTRVELSDLELRLKIMVSADGRIDENIYKTDRVYLNLKKKRKKERCIELLQKLNIDYSHNDDKEVSTISFNSHIKKGMGNLWDANLEQLYIISDEVLYWDGDQKNCFFTRIKEEADFINYVFSATGYRSTIVTDEREDGIDYRVFRHSNTKIGINGTPKTPIKKVESIDGYKYCFTVPSSYLILRRNGRVFITGNCGMCVKRTSLTDIGTKDLKKIMGLIRESVPVGFNHHPHQQSTYRVPEIGSPSSLWDMIVGNQYEKALYQVGTLGGGNHFIEIQKGSDGYIWIMIHSGSRNVGYKVAKHYNELAVEMNEMYFSDVPKDLAFFPNNTEEHYNYMLEMNWCIEFAKLNRELMLENIEKCFTEVLGDVKFSQYCNKPHNFASVEHHYGRNVLVHRKGATRARDGELGMIPSSQGSTSYIVRGKGNSESFHSCSHGAGRLMSRTKARNKLSVAEETKRLDELGILHSIRSESDLDEAPSAYKNMDEVMGNQQDLVDIEISLIPLATIKG